MVLNTMRTVRAWDLDTFLSIPSDQRDEIIKALNEDVNKLLSEIDPSDPLAKRLKDELRLTNEHFYDLLARAQKEPEPDYSNQFDAACAELVRKFEKGWQQLNRRVKERVTTNLEELERQIKKHKAFEDALKTLDVDVSNVKELYRQLPHPTPTQRAAAHDNMVQRWQDIWELSRMYVERLKGLESVLNGLDESIWIEKYARTGFSTDSRCAQISPLWHRGKSISKPVPALALCEYKNKNNIHIRKGLSLLCSSILLIFCFLLVSSAEVLPISSANESFHETLVTLWDPNAVLRPITFYDDDSDDGDNSQTTDELPTTSPPPTESKPPSETTPNPPNPTVPTMTWCPVVITGLALLVVLQCLCFCCCPSVLRSFGNWFRRVWLRLCSCTGEGADNFEMEGMLQHVPLAEKSETNGSIPGTSVDPPAEC